MPGIGICNVDSTRPYSRSDISVEDCQIDHLSSVRSDSKIMPLLTELGISTEYRSLQICRL